MKKTALLLVAVMLVSLLVGCVEDVNNTSDVSDELSAVDVSKDNDKENSKEEVSVEALPAIQPEFSTVISVGMPYTKSAVPGDSYPDSYSTELTDGQYGPAETGDYTDSHYSGYTDQTTDVVIDLGQNFDKMYEFRCGYLSTQAAGINIPGSVKVFVSDDGKTFSEVGRLKIPAFKEGCRDQAVLTTEQYVSGRYVKFECKKNSAWLFLDELEVVADIEGVGDLNAVFYESVKEAYGALGTVSFIGGKTADTSLALQLVSKGAKYTSDGKTVTTFPDAEKKLLTDGKTTGYYEGGVWTGFEGGNAVTIVLDLGKSYDNLSDFRVVCYSNSKAGTNMPVAVTYAVSDDEKEFTDIGRVYGIAADQRVYDFPLVLEKCASGRYVRVTLEATETKMYLLEEVMVSANTGVVEAVGLYPDLSFNTTPKEWDSPSTEKVNLLYKLPVQISCPSDIGDESKQYNSPITLGVMTDGKKATANNIHNGQFFKFNTGAAREIYFDLGATSAVQSFTASFTHHIPWAVVAPSSVSILLSMDTVSWYEAGVMTVTTESDECLVTAEFSLDKAYKARYICFFMDIGQWAGISELEAFGTTSTAGAVSLANSGFNVRSITGKGNQAPSKEVLNGAADLVLLYHGKELAGYTVDELIPYLAYVDKDGNIKDTMFDSFLFLLSGAFPSGVAGHLASNKSDWEWVLNDMFKDEKNIQALDKAAGQVKSVLKLGDDYKYGFTVALYYPHPDAVTFGDVDGDGVSENFSKDEDRLKALTWYMESFEKRLAEYNFKNISFEGYYWYNESVYPEGNAPYIVNETSKIVHNRGYDFFWIPYFVATGFSSWDTFGFDVACMQPNYVFKEETPYTRIEQTANFTKQYGMGIEIEISGKSFTSDMLYKKYLEYLAGGVKYGYMKDCVHMYYQDVYCYYNAAYSKDEMIRLVYDYTYQFIKGTLNAYPEALEPLTFDTEKNSMYIGTLTDNPAGHISFELTKMPEHGTVSIARDGSLVYYPEKDFTGTVTFTYIYNEGLCDSETCTVTVNVK